ncbi:MAG: zinc-ribbon domain-containing protein, partial [Deltaproteobacteria bacterium]|nr:zinc-ribbon domain-containing protein [Deltaproteobacteria bacterium]
MTVFCPNCGKPNTDTATQCVACATALKPKAAASKFKGTMMMSGPAVPPKPGAPGGPPGPGGPPAAGPMGPPPAAPAEPPKNMAFQATMLGPMTPPPGDPGGFGGPPGPQPGFGAP